MINFKLEKLLPEEQKGCRLENRETKDQLLMDKTVLENFKKRHTNLSIVWIDYKKLYDFVPRCWINECMKLFGNGDNARNFSQMEQLKLSRTSNSEDLGEVDVKRGIF